MLQTSESLPPNFSWAILARTHLCSPIQLLPLSQGRSAHSPHKVDHLPRAEWPCSFLFSNVHACFTMPHELGLDEPHDDLTCIRLAAIHFSRRRHTEHCKGVISHLLAYKHEMKRREWCELEVARVANRPRSQMNLLTGLPSVQRPMASSLWTPLPLPCRPICLCNSSRQH